MSVLNVTAERPVSSLRKTLKRDQTLANPCIEEYNNSLKCLEKNHYDRDRCLKQFDNYVRCRKIWDEIIRFRRIKGIKPYVPIPEERAKIKKEFLESEKI